MRRTLLLAGAFLALGAAPPTLPDVPTSTSQPGWSRQGRSLLLYAPDGSLADELGLSHEETPSVTKETRGGVSPDRRAAWTLERKLHWATGRTKMTESLRTLRVYGSSTRALWTDDAVDWPETGEPVQFSEDSTVVLITRRVGEAWRVEARNWMGGSIMQAGPFPRVHSIGLAPKGRFAQIRWSVPDKSDSHTFLDLKTKQRKDLETAELTLGLARIGDDGVVRTGRREALRFELESAAPAPAAPAPAPAPAKPESP